MILDELHTGFRWYDQIEKQNRYKSYCANNCDYKLISQKSDLLPFIIKTEDSGASLVSWKVFCEDGSASIGINGTPQFVEWEGSEYIIYEGGGITGIDLPCGYYYSVIETSQNTFFSEVFFVDAELLFVEFFQDDMPLFTLWNWYDNQLKQNRFKSYCKTGCGFHLLSGQDALLPFMFRKRSMSQSSIIDSWILRNLDQTCEVILDISKLQIVYDNSYDYIIYMGEDLDTLPCGIFESIVTINGLEYFSETIKIISDFETNDLAYLLQENGAKILQESGGGILIP